MCGRFTGNIEREDTLHSIYERAWARYGRTDLKTGEIFPTDTVPILFGEDLQAVPAKWGYPAMRGHVVLINARAETAAEKPSFRESLLLRRCVIPTTGYLEWNAQKTKFHIRRPDTGMLYLGGFCRRFADGGRFVILTTAPNDSVNAIHNRMPVILGTERAELVRWCTDTEWALAYLGTQMPALCAAALS